MDIALTSFGDAVASPSLTAGPSPDAVVYVVDDLATNVTLLAATLRRLPQVEVVGFTEARQALAACGQRVPDLVLVDYQMPDLDGVSFITQLRRLASCAAVPVVVVTGESEPDLLARAFDAGAHDFLRKPVDRTELLVRARCMLRLSDAHRRLSRLAREDELTRLANRRAFIEALQEEFARSARTHQAFALALFDIDHFKSINDRFGHGVGDGVLREVAERIRSAVRVIDVCGRIGGEEFALLLLHTDLDEALATCDRVRASVCARGFALGGDLIVPVTLSGGVAVNARGDDVSTILARADDALYRAKRSGRNRIEQSW